MPRGLHIITVPFKLQRHTSNTGCLFEYIFRHVFYTARSTIQPMGHTTHLGFFGRVWLPEFCHYNCERKSIVARYTRTRSCSVGVFVYCQRMILYLLVKALNQTKPNPTTSHTQLHRHHLRDIRQKRCGSPLGRRHIVVKCITLFLYPERFLLGLCR